MNTLLKYKYSIASIILLFICSLSASAQVAYQKYNENLRITEYYNADSVMVEFSRHNKSYNTIEFYSPKGVKLRSEPAKVEVKKKAYPKAQLTQKELDAVQEWRYQKIGEQNLIRGENPDLEHIGYYDSKGKLVAVKEYNRRTETWTVKFLTSDKE